jgi:hypothetical protein
MWGGGSTQCAPRHSSSGSSARGEEAEAPGPPDPALTPAGASPPPPAGVGPKVAACVALFSLDKHDAIPVDTHVWQVRLWEILVFTNFIGRRVFW